MNVLAHAGRDGVVRPTAVQVQRTVQSTPAFSNLWTVFVVDVHNTRAGGSNGVILRTQDGGANWVQMGAGPASIDWNSLYSLDANRGWAVGGKPGTFTAPARGIIYTDDGGATRQTQDAKSNQLPLNAAFFDDADDGWEVGQEDGILHTSNGGAQGTKQPARANCQLDDAAFTCAGHGCAVGNTGIILHTETGGECASQTRPFPSARKSELARGETHSGARRKSLEARALRIR